MCVSANKCHKYTLPIFFLKLKFGNCSLSLARDKGIYMAQKKKYFTVMVCEHIQKTEKTQIPKA